MVVSYFNNRVYEVIPGLLLSPMPRSEWDLESAKVKLVLTLSPLLPPQAAEKSGLASSEAQGHGRIVYLHWPIEDAWLPDESLLNFIVSSVSLFVTSGKTALVHCSAGVNRSALVVALVVREVLNVSGKEAISILKDARPDVLTNNTFYDYLVDLDAPTRL